MKDNTKSYFQYQKEKDLPVFVRLSSEDFEECTISFLEKMGFSKLEESEVEKRANPRRLNFKLLTMSIASLTVAKQIASSLESDKYGLESIVPKESYRVYRYKDAALMIYSLSSIEWKMGTFSDFGSQDNLIAYQMIINRFLSLALAPLGIVGFWGVPVDEGIVVLRSIDAKSEVVFINVLKREVYSIDGVKKMKPLFKVLKLDKNLKERSVNISSNDLLSFLSVYCSFFDYKGHTSTVRQLIQTFTKMVDAVAHPYESFRPRDAIKLQNNLVEA